MLPSFLLEDGIRREDGTSPAIDLAGAKGSALLVTLGITRIVEQESLDVTIWGSADGETWGAKSIASFPQKFYCGTYSILVDLSAHPDVQFIRAQWKMGRWGRGEPKPQFGFYLFAEPTAVLAAHG